MTKNYCVFLNMYIKDYVKDREMIPRQAGSRQAYVEKIAINPSGYKVVQALISKITTNLPPEMWKKAWLMDVNAVEGKNYDPEMSMDDFMQVLHEEGTITIQYMEDETNHEPELIPSTFEKQNEIKNDSDDVFAPNNHTYLQQTDTSSDIKKKQSQLF